MNTPMKASPNGIGGWDWRNDICARLLEVIPGAKRRDLLALPRATSVIPAGEGGDPVFRGISGEYWIPALAGMTTLRCWATLLQAHLILNWFRTASRNRKISTALQTLWKAWMIAFVVGTVNANSVG